MSETQLLLTEALRKPATSQTLCVWYRADDPVHNRREYKSRYKVFLGKGLTSHYDMNASLDKVMVSHCSPVLNTYNQQSWNPIALPMHVTS